jgi:hypothetical protein
MTLAVILNVVSTTALVGVLAATMRLPFVLAPNNRSRLNPQPARRSAGSRVTGDRAGRRPLVLQSRG